MNLLIDFIDETEEVKEEYMSLICEVLEKAAQMENIEDGAEVSVTFVDNERIREINRDYRDKDQPTDVISLPWKRWEKEKWRLLVQRCRAC